MDLTAYVPIPLGALEGVLRDTAPLMAEIRLELGKGSLLRRRKALNWLRDKLVNAVSPLDGTNPPDDFWLPAAQPRLRSAISASCSEVAQLNSVLAALLKGPNAPASDLLEEIVSQVGLLLWFFVRLPGLEQELLQGESELAADIMTAGAAQLESCSLAWEFRRTEGGSGFLPGLLETLNRLLEHFNTMGAGRGQAFTRLRATVLSPERIVECGARLLKRVMEIKPGVHTHNNFEFWEPILEPGTIYSPERAVIAADSQLREAMITNLTGGVPRFAKRGLGPPYDLALKCAYEEALNTLRYVTLPVLLGDFCDWLQKKPRFLDSLAASFDLVLGGKSTRFRDDGRGFEAKYMQWGLDLLRILRAEHGIGGLATLPWLRRVLALAAALIRKQDHPDVELDKALFDVALFSHACLTDIAGSSPGGALVSALAKQPLEALRAAEAFAVLNAQLPPDVLKPSQQMLREAGTTLHTAMASAVRQFPADVLKQRGPATNAIIWLTETAIKIQLRTAEDAEEDEEVQQMKVSALRSLAVLVGQAWDAMSDALLPDGQQAGQSAVSPAMLRRWKGVALSLLQAIAAPDSATAESSGILFELLHSMLRCPEVSSLALASEAGRTAVRTAYTAMLDVPDACITREQIDQMLSAVEAAAAEEARQGDAAGRKAQLALESGEALATRACANPRCTTLAGTGEEMVAGMVHLTCGRCNLARYCDRACQIADWPAHKPACRELRKRRA